MDKLCSASELDFSNSDQRSFFLEFNIFIASILANVDTYITDIYFQLRFYATDCNYTWDIFDSDNNSVKTTIETAMPLDTYINRHHISNYFDQLEDASYNPQNCKEYTSADIVVHRKPY
jgi:hypothetical protein